MEYIFTNIDELYKGDNVLYFSLALYLLRKYYLADEEVWKEGMER